MIYVKRIVVKVKRIVDVKRLVEGKRTVDLKTNGRHKKLVVHQS